jgi:hypothetical protein
MSSTLRTWNEIVSACFCASRRVAVQGSRRLSFNAAYRLPPHSFVPGAPPSEPQQSAITAACTPTTCPAPPQLSPARQSATAARKFWPHSIRVFCSSRPVAAWGIHRRSLAVTYRPTTPPSEPVIHPPIRCAAHPLPHTAIPNPYLATPLLSPVLRSAAAGALCSATDPSTFRDVLDPEDRPVASACFPSNQKAR